MWHRVPRNRDHHLLVLPCQQARKRIERRLLGRRIIRQPLLLRARLLLHLSLRLLRRRLRLSRLRLSRLRLPRMQLRLLRLWLCSLRLSVLRWRSGCALEGLEERRSSRAGSLNCWFRCCFLQWNSRAFSVELLLESGHRIHTAGRG